MYTCYEFCVQRVLEIKKKEVTLKYLPLLGVFLFGLLGCGEAEFPLEESGDDTVQLEIIGTIGVEMGDSNYVLGAVQSIDHDTQGNILVLDRSACCVRVYSPAGEFVRNISHEGSGPGELVNPMDMTVFEDGRIVVESPWSGGLHGFSPDGEWLGLLTPFYNNPPMSLMGVDDSAFVATRLEVLPDGNGDLTVTTFIGRYELGEEPVLKYWEYEFPFDPNDLTELLRNTVMGHTFTADREGNVFIAELTSEEYLIQGFRADGELFVEIEAEAETVEKTAEEIEEEKIYVEAYLESLGASGVVIDYHPEPLRNTISELEVDGEQRLWVRSGTVLQPVFDVYSYNGDFLFTVNVPGAGSDAQFWDFNIDEQGMIAFSANPELYQQIYILQMSPETIPADISSQN